MRREVTKRKGGVAGATGQEERAERREEEGFEWATDRAGAAADCSRCCRAPPGAQSNTRCERRPRRGGRGQREG